MVGHRLNLILQDDCDKGKTSPTQTHTLTQTHTYLTAVESLEASVISRLPLSPSSAGTRMKTSDTSVKTVQCCKDQHVISITQHQHNEHTAILKRDMSDSQRPRTLSPA